MKLVEGKGNAYNEGRALEDDSFNTVYVLVRAFLCRLPAGQRLRLAKGSAANLQSSVFCRLGPFHYSSS
jgi:hypothetical protein